MNRIASRRIQALNQNDACPTPAIPRRPARPMAWLRSSSVVIALVVFSFTLTASAGRAPLIPIADVTNGHVTIKYRSGETLIFTAPPSAPAGVELLRPGAPPAPVLFPTIRQSGDAMELGPTQVGSLTFRFRIVRKTPSLVERTLEVMADSAEQFAVTFPLEAAVEGEYASFTGPETARTDRKSVV